MHRTQCCKIKRQQKEKHGTIKRETRICNYVRTYKVFAKYCLYLVFVSFPSAVNKGVTFLLRRCLVKFHVKLTRVGPLRARPRGWARDLVLKRTMQPFAL